MNEITNDVEKELENLVNICHANLKNSKKCLSYLHNDRKMSDDIISKYKLGYFPQNTEQLCKFVSPTTLQKLSIVDYNQTSKFSELFFLIFPIISEYGKVQGIGGRTLLSETDRKVLEIPKYKNSSFHKANYLFGLDKARSSILKNKNVYVVEGFFDQISMNSNDITNVVAICGTGFSKNHFIKLARYTEKITFILDSDDGGQNSMKRIYEKYDNLGINLEFLSLPSTCKDVDDYFSHGGSKEKFYKELEYFVPNW